MVNTTHEFPPETIKPKSQAISKKQTTNPHVEGARTASANSRGYPTLDRSAHPHRSVAVPYRLAVQDLKGSAAPT